MTNPHHATPSGKPRARALGVPFDGTPGEADACDEPWSIEVVLFGGNTVVRGGILVLLVGVTLLARWAARIAAPPPATTSSTL